MKASGAALFLLAALACTPERITETKRVSYLDGAPYADVTETVRVNADGGRIVQRFHKLRDEHGGFRRDVAMSLDRLDKDGFAVGASYRREGPLGKRYVELRRWDKGGPNDGKLVIFSRGDDEALVLPERPIVVVDAAHFVTARNVDVTLVDVENAAFTAAHIDAGGALTPAPRLVDALADAPPAGALAVHAATTAPALSNQVEARHRARAPFIESEAPKVVKWCKLQAAPGEDPVKAAKAIALAVKPKLAAEKAGGPPSALTTVESGGFDEGGAALTAACARAIGIPARVVTGTVAGAARSWTQVHDGKAWVDVDATDIDVDGNMKLPHDARREGLPDFLAR